MTTATCTNLATQYRVLGPQDHTFQQQHQQQHHDGGVLTVPLAEPDAKSSRLVIPIGSLPPTAPPTPACSDSSLILPSNVSPPTTTTHGPVPPRPVPRKQREIPPPPPFAPIHDGDVLANFRAALDQVDVEECEENGENAFYVCDLAEVYRQAMRWHRVVGDRVQPFFAVKCNPDPHVLRLLAALGTGFDCASHAEISLVLSLGVSPSRIIYANPCKAGSFIRHAAQHHVEMMTFDNADELDKVVRFHPNAKLVLRILTDDSGSLCRFGDKFGAPLAESRPLLEKAKRLGLDVIGVSFHVGSGCTNADLYRDAIGRAKQVFDTAKDVGYRFDLLDVGGGFGDENFERLAVGLRKGLDEFFPLDGDGKDVRVIAEPGRYFVTKAFELATNVIARRKVAESELAEVEHDLMEVPRPGEDRPLTLYYINDGLYGAFNAILFEQRKDLQPEILTLSGDWSPTTDLASRARSADARSTAGQECKIFGPTCDSIDLVSPLARLPVDRVEVGDWLRWEEMGAYTICAASQFNGFRTSEVRYCVDGKGDAGTERRVRDLIQAAR